MNNSDLKNINETYLAKWLNNEISDKEVKTFISEKDFLAYTKIKNGLEFFVAPEFDIHKTQQKLSKHIPKKQTKVFHLKWFAIAATILILIASAYFFNTSLPIHHQTKSGEQKTIVLNDGSEAILNAKSYIQYPKKWKNKRELNLRGEAFFKVKKGNSFTVNTMNGVVTALGTKFIVNAQPDFLLVKCFEGKVMVVKNKDTIYLTKGKAFQYNNSDINTWEFQTAAPHWLDGESYFKSTPLKIVIKSLEDQFGIRINDKNINANRLFTGSYTHNDLNIALKSVFLPMDIEFNIENKKVFLSKK